MLINSTFCNTMAHDLLNWLNFDFLELYRTLFGQKTQDEDGNLTAKSLNINSNKVITAYLLDCYFHQ